MFSEKALPDTAIYYSFVNLFHTCVQEVRNPEIMLFSGF